MNERIVGKYTIININSNKRILRVIREEHGNIFPVYDFEDTHGNLIAGSGNYEFYNYDEIIKLYPEEFI